jgi:hypothetical protein
LAFPFLYGINDTGNEEAIAPDPLLLVNAYVIFFNGAFVIDVAVQVSAQDNVFVVGHLTQNVFQVKAARAIFPGVEVGQGEVGFGHGWWDSGWWVVGGG